MMRNGGDLGGGAFFCLSGGLAGDDDCPICRAHGGPAGKDVISSPFGEIIVHSIPTAEMMRCPCPMCRQARENGAGN